MTADEVTHSRFRTPSPTAETALSAWCRRRPRRGAAEPRGPAGSGEPDAGLARKRPSPLGLEDEAGDQTVQSRGGGEGREGPRCPTGLSGPAGVTLPGRGAGAAPAQRPWARAPPLPWTLPETASAPRNHGGLHLGHSSKPLETQKTSMKTGKLFTLPMRNTRVLSPSRVRRLETLPEL